MDSFKRVEAAKSTYLQVELIGASVTDVIQPLLKSALTLLERCHPLTSRASQRLEYRVLTRYQWTFMNSGTMATEEGERCSALLKTAGEYEGVQPDTVALFLSELTGIDLLLGYMPFAWDNDRQLTNAMAGEGLARFVNLL